MNFTSSLFLVGILPWLVFILYFLRKRKNIHKAFLLCFSIFFYMTSGVKSVFLILIVAAITWIFHRILFNYKNKFLYILAYLLVLSILVIYKNFYAIFSSFNNVFHASVFEATIAYQLIVIPMGLSFFTFQAISCIGDTYYNRVKCKLNFIDIFSYLIFFPTITSGPIMRINDFCSMDSCCVTSATIHKAVTRIIFGLSKKLLIADKIALLVNRIYETVASDFSLACVELWIGAFAYALQIYFDFSGYSDIAIGIGQIIGVKIPENFNHPYRAKSIQEFWRKWHISLSQWFRDYVYIPLGGSRCSKVRNILNLLAVWILTGIWHGLDITFIIWGIGHFLLLLFEKYVAFSKRVTQKWYGHVYTILLVTILWVPFRAENMEVAVEYLSGMCGYGCSSFANIDFHTLKYIPFLLFSAILCLPWKKYLNKFLPKKMYDILLVGCLAILYILVICAINNANFSPYIYGNF